MKLSHYSFILSFVLGQLSFGSSAELLGDERKTPSGVVARIAEPTATASKPSQTQPWQGRLLPKKLSTDLKGHIASFWDIFDLMQIAGVNHQGRDITTKAFSTMQHLKINQRRINAAGWRFLTHKTNPNLQSLTLLLHQPLGDEETVKAFTAFLTPHAPHLRNLHIELGTNNREAYTLLGTQMKDILYQLRINKIQFENLQTLTIRNLRIGSSGVSLLSKTLPQSTKLLNLELCECNTDFGPLDLSTSLYSENHHPYLTELNLSGNSIWSTEVIRLMRHVQNFLSLKKLAFSKSININDNCINALGTGISSLPHLKELDLSKCGLSEKGQQQLRDVCTKRSITVNLEGNVAEEPHTPLGFIKFGPDRSKFD